MSKLYALFYFDKLYEAYLDLKYLKTIEQALHSQQKEVQTTIREYLISDMHPIV